MKYSRLLVAILTFLVLADAWCQGSFQLESGTNLDYRTITNNVSFPWEVLWGNDAMLWVTEKGSGSLRPQISRIDPVTGAKTVIYTPPAGVMAEVDAPPGLLGMAFHPNFDPNNPSSDPSSGTNIVFITYTASDFTQHLASLTYDGVSLSNLQVLAQSSLAPSNHGSRLIITNDNYLLWSTGADDQNDGQNVDNLVGKILRVDLDGVPPAENPFFTNVGAERSKVFSFGHRNPQGLIQLPSSHPNLPNYIYSSEHGGTQNDEVNLINPGNNYGWPNNEGFCTSSTSDNECPLVTFDEAPTGLLYYDHPAIPEWNGSILMGTSKGSKLVRLLLNSAGEITNKDVNGSPNNNIDLTGNSYTFDFSGVVARPRAMTMSPDGKVYVASLNAASDGSQDRIFVIENPDFTGCGDSGTPTCQQFNINTAPQITMCDAQSISLELSGSEAGVSYEIYINGNPSGIVAAGTGCNLSFLLSPTLLIQNNISFSDGDVLTIVATTSGCTSTMSGSVTLNIENLFAPRYYTENGTSEAPSFDGISYQWFNDGGVISGATSRILANSTSDSRVVVSNCGCSVWATQVDSREEVAMGHELGSDYVFSRKITQSLDVPWAIEFGLDHLWITERDLGEVIKVDPATGATNTVLSLGTDEQFDATTSPRAGLMGMAVDWDSNPVNFFLAYTYNDGSLKLRLSAFEYNESAEILENEQILVENIPSQTNHGSALLFENGFLYASTGSVDNDEAQSLNNLVGKILWINPSNPSSNISELIHSYGHRNPQGLTSTPDGKIYSSEHGEVGGDELNLIQEDFNYGWPNFRGECTSSIPDQNECPEMIFGSVAPGGLAYYDESGEIPALRNTILMANLRANSLVSVGLSSEYNVQGVSQSLFGRSDCGIYGRLRDVAVSNTGEIFLLSNGSDHTSANIYKLSLNADQIELSTPNQGDQLFVYPNPTTEFLYIRDAQKRYSYEIFDISGNRLRMKLEENTEAIDVSKLNAGIYFIKYESEDGIKSIRFVKK